MTPARDHDPRRRADEAATLRPISLTALAAAVTLKLAIHLPLVSRYGYFRDELYFLDLGRNLDWGYVDCAPLIGLLARLALLLGGSLEVLRVIAALAGAGVVAMAVLLARELGGGRFAQFLAGLAVIATPIFLATSSIMTMNGFEPLFWLGCAWVIARLVRTGDSRLWLAFGLLAGLGLQNKHSMLVFGAAVALALPLTGLRRELARRWIWLGLGVALLLFLPNVLWQVANDFPTLEDLRNVRESGKNVVLAPPAFLGQQAMMVHPLLAPLWVGGLLALLAGRLRAWRPLGLTYLFVLAVFMVMHGKDYYVAPAYPMLFAAGAVAVEAWLDRVSSPRRSTWPRVAAVGWIATAGAATLPLVTPLLPPERYVAYQRALGVEAQKTEVAHEGPLPQIFGDQFGWPEFAADVARVYRALPAEERARACIFANNYGEAGALSLFGPGLGLPTVISGHQNHFFWGPKGCSGEVLIVTQSDREDLEEVCASVEQAGTHAHPWGMAEENQPIWVCRGLEPPPAELWPRVKHWN
ncbi:MAG: glycosyltransferase family 39 protein [Acidobacteriota bacterium]